jgi:threonine dehydratase
MVTLEEIRIARERIGRSVLLSPCPRSETFSEPSRGEVFLKLENLQRTGSYKERGALNRILTLTAKERELGLVAASAGNHAQAVAYHAAKLGLRAEICMPLATPLNKVLATRRHGAEIVLCGESYDEAEQEARRRASANEYTFVHAFDDDAVIAGQGTRVLRRELRRHRHRPHLRDARGRAYRRTLLCARTGGICVRKDCVNCVCMNQKGFL